MNTRLPDIKVYWTDFHDEPTGVAEENDLPEIGELVLFMAASSFDGSDGTYPGAHTMARVTDIVKSEHDSTAFLVKCVAIGNCDPRELK